MSATEMRDFCMIKTKIGASIQKLRVQKIGGVSLQFMLFIFIVTLIFI